MFSVLRRRLAAALAVAVLAVLPSLAYAEDDPIAFVQSLYDLPNLWNDVTADGPAISKYLDKNLGALITANYAKSDYTAALDYDPLVQAQDFDQVKATLKLEKATGTTATVDATVANLGDVTDVKLDLTKTADGWRLSNVRTDEESPSLVDELKQLNSNEPDGSDPDADTDMDEGQPAQN